MSQQYYLVATQLFAFPAKGCGCKTVWMKYRRAPCEHVIWTEAEPGTPKYEVLKGYATTSAAKGFQTRWRKCGFRVTIFVADLSTCLILTDDLNEKFQVAESVMLNAGRVADELQSRLSAGEVVESRRKAQKNRPHE